MTVREFMITRPIETLMAFVGCGTLLSMLAYGLATRQVYWLVAGGIGSVLSIGLVALVIALS